MSSKTSTIGDLELVHRLDAVYRASKTAASRESRQAMPSLSESRDLLRLFVRLGDEDLHHAVLCLLRTIIGPTH